MYKLFQVVNVISQKGRIATTQWTAQWYSPGGANVHASYILHLAYLSPQPKWHLDPLGHFCTAHGKMSSGMRGHVHSLTIVPWHRAIWTPI